MEMLHARHHVATHLGDGRIWVNIPPYGFGQNAGQPAPSIVDAVEEQSTEDGVFARSADVLMAFQLPDLPNAQIVELLIPKGGTIPCVQEGEGGDAWWALSIPIFHNLWYYGTPQLRVDGQLVMVTRMVQKMLYLTKAARKRLVDVQNEHKPGAPPEFISYAAGIAMYDKGHMYVLPNLPEC